VKKTENNNPPTSVSMGHIVQSWWPLAMSWLFMAAEGPMMNAVVARMANPEIHLAAWGGVVIALSLIIEAPIIMLLSASTALSKDWDSFVKLRRFMMSAGAILTVIHVLIAFTPLYDIVVVDVIGAPAEIVQPARIGLMIMTPWTWAIAYRRFNQGVLIRFGHSRAVSVGTVIRLSADGLVLGFGYLVEIGALSIPSGPIPGIIVATSAIATGVVSEAVYAGLRVRPVLRDQLKEAPPTDEPLTLPIFLAFYTPLAMTSLLNMLIQPLISAALSRMPAAIESLAAWSVVSGFIFLFRSLGYAYNEVVIALLEKPKAVSKLRRFAIGLSLSTSLLLLVIAATPLGAFWFEQISALPPHLSIIASASLWVALPIPGLNVLMSWYQGILVHNRRTRAISEAMAIFLLIAGGILLGGVLWGNITGLYVGLAAFGIGMLGQTAWLWRRSRSKIQDMRRQESQACCRCVSPR